ncbi:MAG: hypothetical protein QF752_14295 [Planctomycetota bacterium]|nr:hypothetical protein [Planctomycetota bacterium]
MKNPLLPIGLGFACIAIAILFNTSTSLPEKDTNPRLPTTESTSTPPLRVHRTSRQTSPTSPSKNDVSPPQPKRTSTETPPSSGPESGPYITDPSRAVLKRLETLISRRDAPALLELVRTEKSLARYEALHQHLELVGPTGLPNLIHLLKEDTDPALHRVLEEAFAAGGDSSIAESLASNLSSLPSDSALLAASLGILGISERESVSRSSRDRAIQSLETLIRKDPDLASDACAGLSESGASGLDGLERLASDHDLEESSRFTAAEALHQKNPQRARRHLEQLAQEGNDPDVRQMARLYLEQSDGE